MSATTIFLLFNTVIADNLIYAILLECHANHKPNAIPVASRQILIVQTLYVFYMQELEDVVNTSYKLYVWALRIHDVATLWELP